jgi:hypothetical protein
MITSKLSDISMCINVIEDINNMKKGIINLQHTYQDDAIIVSKLETFVQEIESKLLEFKKNNEAISTQTLHEVVPEFAITATQADTIPETPIKTEKHKHNVKK